MATNVERTVAPLGHDRATHRSRGERGKSIAYIVFEQIVPEEDSKSCSNCLHFLPLLPGIPFGPTESQQILIAAGFEYPVKRRCQFCVSASNLDPDRRPIGPPLKTIFLRVHQRLEGREVGSIFGADRGSKVAPIYSQFPSVGAMTGVPRDNSRTLNDGFGTTPAKSHLK